MSLLSLHGILTIRKNKTGYPALQMQEVRKDICRFGWQESALLEADSLRTSQSCQLNEFGEFFHLILFVQQSAINAKFSFFIERI